MTTGKAIALTRWTFVGKVMSLLFNMLSRLVIAFLPRSSSFNYCFLICIQMSQDAGQVVWYSHILKNFPQFVVIHIVKGFVIVNKAEIDVSPEISCFFNDPTDVGNLISGSFAFSKISLRLLLLLLSRLSHVRPHRLKPTRLPCPLASPGKNTGVGCHFLLQYMKVKSESEVTQSCSIPSDPMDYSLPGSSVHGIFQARVLEWGAITFSANHLEHLVVHGSCIAEARLGEF